MNEDIKLPASHTNELTFKQKCFQSLLNLKDQKDNGGVIVCLECCIKWFSLINECPLCRSNESIEEMLKGDPRSFDKTVEENLARSTEMPKKSYEELSKDFAKECGHAHCQKCCERWLNTIHVCLFCGKNISLIRFAESQTEGLTSPKVEYKDGPLFTYCRECFCSWKPGVKKCKFCLKETTASNDHANDPSNKASTFTFIQASLVLKEALDEIQKIRMILQHSFSSGTFGRPNPAYETAKEAPVSNNNNGLNASENVQNLTINERSAMSGDIQTGQEDLATLLTEDEGAKDVLVE